MAGVRQHMKNLLALCGSNFFLMCSYFTAVTLQSSLNTEGHMGLGCLALLYFFYSLSSFISPVVISKLNTKWTVFLTSVIYSTFIASNIYPKLYTLLPVSLLVGLSAGPLWTAQGKHLTTTAINVALLTKENVSAITSRFNGMFYLFYAASLIPGNIISSLLLHGGNISSGTHRYIFTSHCGIKYCNYRQRNNIDVHPISYHDYMNSTDRTNGNQSNNMTSYMIQIPNPKIRLTLFAILLGWGLLGSLLAILFIDPLRSFCKIVPQPKQFRDHSKDILKLMKRRKFLLLIPLISFTSLEMGFSYSTFTKSYVTCSMGVQNLGFVMATYGLGGLLAAVVSGVLVKYTGRMALLSAGFICQMCLFVLMWMWVPQPGQEWQVYGIASVCGIGGSIRLTQICAFLGLLFPRDQEAAFTAFNFWYGIGFSVYFALATLYVTCVGHMICMLLIWLVIAMIPYYMLEWKIRRAGFFSINDETGYEERWQEINKNKKMKLFEHNFEQHNNSATSCYLNAEESNCKSISENADTNSKVKRYSKLLIDEVETVV